MPTPDKVAVRLRQIRQQQNLTLKQVEIRSRGEWKAVVVGSYERGTRSLSIHRAQELCNFYGVPLSALLREPPNDDRQSAQRALVFDLRKLRIMHQHPDNFTQQIFQLLQGISEKRDDWNGEVLSIRKSDREILELLTQKNAIEIDEALQIRDLLLKN